MDSMVRRDAAIEAVILRAVNILSTAGVFILPLVASWLLAAPAGSSHPTPFNPDATLDTGRIHHVATR